MTDSNKKLGPNVKRLIAHKMSLDAVPPGTTDGLLAGIQFLKDPGRITKAARQATLWVGEVIQAVRLAKEPNPWKGRSDDEIAAEILRRVDERRKQTRNAYRSKGPSNV